MTRRNILALLLGLAAAAVCIRLGLWQLDRLHSRRARNAAAAAGFDAPAIAPGEVPRNADSARYRRVRVRGGWDFANEIALTGRARDGSPGVNIVTPVRPDGGGPAVLVNRGWVYAADAATVDLSRWREPERADLEGYVVELPTAERDPRSPGKPRSWRALDAARLQRVMPYPIAPFYVIALPDSVTVDSTAGYVRPARLARPTLDDGPHLSYAVQWFAFALIAVVGAAALIWQDVRAHRAGQRGAES